MENSYEITPSTVRKYITARNEFKQITNSLELDVRDNKLVIVRKENKQVIGLATLKKIYLLMEVGFDVLDDDYYYDLLIDIFLEKLSFEEVIELDKKYK